MTERQWRNQKRPIVNKNESSEFSEEDNIVRMMDDKIWIPMNGRKDFIIDCHSKLC